MRAADAASFGARRAAAPTSSWRAGSSTTATAARRPRSAKAQAFRCDSHGCTARVKGMLLAVANSPAALRDDCAAAAILVLKFAKPKGCAPPGPAIDTDDLSARGAHALHIDGGQSASRPWPIPAATALGRRSCAETIMHHADRAMTTGRRAAGGCHRYRACHADRAPLSGFEAHRLSPVVASLESYPAIAPVDEQAIAGCRILDEPNRFSRRSRPASGHRQNRRISPTSRPWMSTWSGPKMRVS